MKRLLIFILFITFFYCGVGTPYIFAQTQNPIVGLGILGDSGPDEYRANDNRGGPYGNTTYNWVELLANKRSINIGAWGTYSEPRRIGYAYNWARSGATTATMISSGQHTGLAAQIRSGLVNTVVIFIGTNDVTPVATSIYNGTMTDAQISSFVSTLASNVETAVTTLQSAGNSTIFLSKMSDFTKHPAVVSNFPNAAGRQRLSSMITQLNSLYANIATRKSMTIWDSEASIQAFNLYDSAQNILLLGETILYTPTGDEPHHEILGDNTHVGTVVAGLQANTLISLLNVKVHASIPVFTYQEILENAAIHPRISSTSTPIVQKIGDGNRDGKVNGQDYIVWLVHFGNNVTDGMLSGDYDLNGFVNGLDYITWLTHYEPK